MVNRKFLRTNIFKVNSRWKEHMIDLKFVLFLLYSIADTTLSISKMLSITKMLYNIYMRFFYAWIEIRCHIDRLQKVQKNVVPDRILNINSTGKWDTMLFGKLFIVLRRTKKKRKNSDMSACIFRQDWKSRKKNRNLDNGINRGKMSKRIK